MRINSVNNIAFYDSNKYKPNILKDCPTFRASASFDTFRKTFSKLKNFTLNEYNQLSKSEINLINKNIDKMFADDIDFHRALKYHDIVAEGMKQTLNNCYGVGNYIVIPIGRSLSSICKCLGYKIGEEKIKLLPMSQAGRFWNYYENEDIELFRKYLDSIELSQDTIKTSGKKYIFTDYCNSGDSLIGAKKLLTSKIFDNDNNLEFIDVFQLIEDLQPNKIRNDISEWENYIFKNTFRGMLRRMEFKRYSLVDKCINLDYTKEAVIKPEHYRPDAKCFWFKLMDNEANKMKQNIRRNKKG